MINIDIENKEDSYQINKIIDEITPCSKKNFIVIDNDILKLKKYSKLSKNVIVYNKEKNVLNNHIYYEDNIYLFSYLEELAPILESIIEKRKIRNRNKIITSLSLLLFLLITIIINNTIVFEDNNKEDTINKEEIVKEIEDYKKENFVFYGDSITECYEVEKYFPDLPVVNTAHWGYLTPTLLKEVEERVLDYNPTKVFLLMGTNDLGYSDSTDEEIFKNIKKLVHIIKKDRKDVKIYIESIYPVNETIDIDAGVWHIRENSRIRNINSMLEELCNKEHYTYIDLYSVLKEEDGSINDDYTVEGLHINQEGYKTITKTIESYLKEA